MLYERRPKQRYYALKVTNKSLYSGTVKEFLERCFKKKFETHEINGNESLTFVSKDETVAFDVSIGNIIYINTQIAKDSYVVKNEYEFGRLFRRAE